MIKAGRVSTVTKVIDTAATRLKRAADTHAPCAPVRDLLGDNDIGLAYQVQAAINDWRIAQGAHVVGRKIGLTSPAVQQQLGVDQPDFGVLFADMQCGDGETVAMSRLLQPKVEAEIAFVLNADLDEKGMGLDDVRAAVEFAMATLEIVDSRVRDWDIAITDTVADNASSGMFVLSSHRVTLDEFEPADVQMQLAMDGSVASTGTGSACLGDPLNALLWLARAASYYGSPLRRGEIVLSGALGPMVPVGPGSEVVASIGVLGQVSVSFS
jgi:2-keto-4-pentenoate hydratase